MTRPTNSIIAIALPIFVWMIHGSFAVPVEESAARPQPDSPEKSIERKDHILSADLARLESLGRGLGEMATDMAGLQDQIKFDERGFFTSEENDLIEGLLFRYQICRDSLWDIIGFYRDYEEYFETEEQRAKAFTIGYGAASELYFYSSTFVDTFLEMPGVKAKLNEAYHRSDIAAGSYDQIFKSLTDPKNIRDYRASWELYTQELLRPDSPLKEVAYADPRYGAIVSNIRKSHDGVEARIEKTLDTTSILLPGVRNSLRHSEIQRFAEATRDKSGGAYAAMRALTFTNVSRLKKPMTPPIVFAADQIEEMKETLQPGDIILTYSAGYMSNVFLPGAFKHGITYVGSPEDRREVGLYDLIEDKDAATRERFEAALNRDTLADGSQADLIEAVAEGVIFSSLDHLLTDRVNRLVVWRPQLTEAERLQDLDTVFSLVGSAYDFKFDFNDAAYQCCTEVIYRAINKAGEIRLELSERMGRQTLSADDICNYAVGAGKDAFEFVVLAVPEGAGRKVRLVSGNSGLVMLKGLLTTP